MKKHLLVVCLLCASVTLPAETLKMKSGDLISGSILSQTEYTLNLATSYGNITLNQREIEAILPDKHRVILKGGTQLVGVILDLDEFNLKLQTDDGAVVNIDMPQIVSVETYDYDRGASAQQEFVKENIAQQQAAEAAQAARQTASLAGAPAGVEAAGGLTFDSDIDQVFDTQKATVVNGAVITPRAQVEVAAPRLMTDEEAFLKGVKTGEVSAQDYAAETKKELASGKSPKQPKKVSARPLEKNQTKYFAVEAGAMPLDLLFTGQVSPAGLGAVLPVESLDVGGTSAAISSKFLWRVKESNLWLGPTISFANIPNNSYRAEDSGILLEASSSGSILTLGAAGNYYLTPASRFALYLTASAAYEMLTFNYRGEVAAGGKTYPFRDSIKTSGFSGSAGIGIETWVDDLMLGVEVRQVFAQRADELKESAAANTVFQAQLSWKF